MTGSSSHDSRRRERIDTGLYRRVTATGEEPFVMIVWQSGRQRAQTLPKGTTEKQAKQAARKALAASGDGMAPLGTAVPFAEVAADYLAHAQARTKIISKGRMSERTVQLYESRLRHYVTPVIGRRKLSQLGKARVLRVLDGCRAAGFSDWTTHGVLTALKAVLRFARERDLMTVDPFQGVPRDLLPAQESQTETRALRPEEASLLLAQLQGRDHVLGCLLADAGLRLSEALGLTWADVSLSDGSLRVRGQLAQSKAGEPPRIIPPKSRRGVQVVPLLPRLQSALEALYAGEDDAAFVLRTRRGTPLNRHNAARSIREAGVRAKLGHVTPQVLRRTLGTALSDAGLPVASAAQIMGHSVEVNHGEYVKAHRDQLEREQACDALVRLGLGVTRT